MQHYSSKGCTKAIEPVKVVVARIAPYNRTFRTWFSEVAKHVLAYVSLGSTGKHNYIRLHHWLDNVFLFVQDANQGQLVHKTNDGSRLQVQVMDFFFFHLLFKHALCS